MLTLFPEMCETVMDESIIGRTYGGLRVVRRLRRKKRDRS